jgi:hypothetical protein
MYIDGDRVVVSCMLDLSEVMEFATFVKERLEFIEGVDIEEESLDAFGTSSLFALLVSLKKTKPDMDIPLLKDGGFASNQLGTFNWRIA